MNSNSRIGVKTRIGRAAIAAALIASTAVFASGAQAAEGYPEHRSEYDHLIDSEWRSALEAAINPDDYVCGPTDFRFWIEDLVDSISDDALNVIGGYGVDAWPTFYALAFDNDDSDEYIGVNGEYTRELGKRHRVDQQFWDVYTKDVQLQAMHGSIIADDSKMVPFVQWFFDTSEEEAQGIVDLVQYTIETDPSVDYDNPIFTLNAFAFSAGGEEIPGFGKIPDKIVMGDGILVALEDLGLGRNGPDFVHAHEFAHHVQFEIGAFDSDLPQPEATRRTELMADAFAAYNVAHSRGASMQTKRIVDVVRSAMDVGDCAFDSPGHHGTPNQREAAARWGADLANSARPQGKINSSALMLDLFEAELPSLIAPDAP